MGFGDAGPCYVRTMTLPWLSPNPRADRRAPYGPAQRAVIDPSGLDELAATMARCPLHAPTPLLALPALAARWGLGDLRIKDESKRFGFGAFKALGGVLAVYGELASAIDEADHRQTSFDAVLAGDGADVTADMVFATASSGNHGRAVAAGARLFGRRCVVFLPAFTDAAKEAAIRARGAEVIRVAGDYDAAVAECRRRSAAEGWTVVSDTSWEGYERAPVRVMRGYSLIAEEMLATQWPEGPTHLFVQAGVGGLAAAMIGMLWAALPRRPLSIVVEPETADCWFQSNRAGQPTLASGDATTAMGGLACREISPVTWPIIGLGADWFMTIREGDAVAARRLLARPDGGDPALAAGFSGAAGLAGLMRAATEPEARRALGLDGDARILLINSEGDLGAPPV